MLHALRSKQAVAVQGHRRAPAASHPTSAHPADVVPRKSGDCACGGGCPSCRQNGSPIHTGTTADNAITHTLRHRGDNHSQAEKTPQEHTGVFSADDVSDEQTGMSATTAGNRIDFTFDPSTTTPTPQCDRIPIVQAIQMIADGSPINPGTYYTPWTCRDAVAIGNGTYIDAHTPNCPCASSYYTACFNGTDGRSNAMTVNATCMDAPMTSGGDRGFASGANPGGWSTVTYRFETYGICNLGTDCAPVSGPGGGPTWYDGIAWEYTKTAADHAAGGNGTSTALASLPPPTPGSDVVTAYEHFNSVQGFVPCI